MSNTYDQLRNQVISIAYELGNPAPNYCRECERAFDEAELSEDTPLSCPECGEDLGPASGFDYLQDALDIEYIVSSRKEYLGARVLVSFGSPDIWVNTRRNVVEGYWWGDSATASFADEIGLNDALEELFKGITYMSPLTVDRDSCVLCLTVKETNP